MSDSDDKNSELLDKVVSLCNQLSRKDTISESEVFIIENFLYGNLVKGILTTFLAEENRKELNEKFEISDGEIDEVRFFPALVNFIDDDDPQGSAQDYKEFKEMIETTVNPKILKFIENYEKLVLLNKCEVQIGTLRESPKYSDIAGIRIGFTDSNGTFTDLHTAKFNYFNNYTDEKLDDIYEKSPYNRAVIDEVREFRKKYRNSG